MPDVPIKAVPHRAYQRTLAHLRIASMLDANVKGHNRHYTCNRLVASASMICPKPLARRTLPRVRRASGPGIIMFAFSSRTFSPLYLPYELGNTYDRARPHGHTDCFLRQTRNATPHNRAENRPPRS